MLFNNSAGLSEFRRRLLKLRGTQWGIGRAVGILVSPPDPRPSNRPSLQIWNREHLHINKTFTFIRSVTDEAVADWSKKKKLVWWDLLVLITLDSSNLRKRLEWKLRSPYCSVSIQAFQHTRQAAEHVCITYFWRERVQGCDPMLISLSCVL